MTTFYLNINLVCVNNMVHLHYNTKLTFKNAEEIGLKVSDVYTIECKTYFMSRAWLNELIRENLVTLVIYKVFLQ